MNKNQLVCLWIGIGEIFVWILECVNSVKCMRMFWPILIGIIALVGALMWTSEKESRLSVEQIIIINGIAVMLIIIAIAIATASHPATRIIY